jgi:prohibitin 1
LYNVDAGHRAVLFDRFRGGIQPKAAAEGTHFLIPWVQQAHVMEVRSEPKVISTETPTKDLQSVRLTLRVLYRPDVEHLPEIYQRQGRDFANRLLPSFGNESLKAIVAQFNAEELLTLRDQVSKEIRASLKERCKLFHIILDDVALTHLAFSDEFTRAIEDKQVAEQMAERAKFVVAKAEQERQAKVIHSEGDAEAARMVSEAIAAHGRGLIEIRRIEAAQHIAETLARARGNITYLPSKGNVLLNIPDQPVPPA